MANSSHKSRQQKANVAARKKKAKDTAKAAQAVAEINRKTRRSMALHRNNRSYQNIIDRMTRPTDEQMRGTERLLCEMFGEKYRP